MPRFPTEAARAIRIVYGVLFLTISSLDVCAEATTNDTSWDLPKFSTYRCVGMAPSTRACLFKNIMYGVKDEQFFFIRGSGSVPESATATNETFAALRFAPEFSIAAVSASALPPSSQVYTVSAPCYLHAVCRSHSFGHLVRDNFPWLPANLHDLGLEQYSYRLVAFSPVVPGTRIHPKLLIKYARWVAPAYTDWQRLIAAAGQPYVLLEDVIVGSLLFKYHNIRTRFYPLTADETAEVRTPQPWGGTQWGAHNIFQLQRDVAYRAAGVGAPVDSSRHSPIKVVLGDKSAGDKRRILNIAELLPMLQQRFSDLKVQSINLSKLSATEQLVELSSTSIFISPLGSSSMRQAYLPPGAHVIVVGNAEVSFDGEYANADPFVEVRQLWEKIPYLHFHYYHSTERDETVRSNYSRPKLTQAEASYWAWYDADSRLHADKLGDIIEHAVRAIQSAAANKGSTQTS